MILYRLFNLFLGYIKLLFSHNRNIWILQTYPQKGSIFFSATHPNSLIDPVLVSFKTPRLVRLIGKYSLFKMPFIRTIARGIQAVPIKRAQDSGLDPSQMQKVNDQAFGEMYKAFNKGQCIGIWPEGASIIKPGLLPFRTGIARILFGGINDIKKKHPEKSISVILIGINYTSSRKYQSSIFLVYGPVMEVSDEVLEMWRKEPRTTVKKLTLFFEKCTSRLFLNCPDWETFDIVSTTQMCLSDKNYSPRKFTELGIKVYECFKRFNKEDEDCKKYIEVSQKYSQNLKKSKIQDSEIIKNTNYSVFFGSLKIFFSIIFVIIYFVFALPGLVLNFPLVIHAIRTGLKSYKKPENCASSRLLFFSIIGFCLDIIYSSIIAKIFGGIYFLPAFWVFALGHATSLFVNSIIGLSRKIRSTAKILKKSEKSKRNS
ncbi:glycerol-3-phosphate o-acyltransferase 1 [Anaeramoeba ignava]|uniref:Glycerol-3-phosphate o-acyltransferase 1 n=1 Tax=Anaeramoeba ignava TaxID=1746090 RepID=A0A9Q0R7J2_ANAIG|nr:glycerol-3-phosphate o-acyltransferase 1 [Anaeramoeba ignava]